MAVNWGFLGAGWVARRALAPAVHAASNARLYAVASRDRGRSASLQPEVVHDTYESLLDDPAVDVVYIGLANHQHAEWAVRALGAGKHVLCEKPLAVSADEADWMAHAAVAADRLLVEAVWCRWHPRFRRLVELATSGALGDLREVASSFTFPADVTGNYRSRPELGGGALLDVGGYQVHAWVALTGGADRLRVRSVQQSLGPTGIDLTTRIAATLDDRVQADALCSFEMPEQQALSVVGSAATATTGAGAAFTSWRETSSLLVGAVEETFVGVDAYEVMVAAMSDRTATGEGWVVPLAESVRVAEIIDALTVA